MPNATASGCCCGRVPRGPLFTARTIACGRFFQGFSPVQISGLDSGENFGGGGGVGAPNEFENYVGSEPFILGGHNGDGSGNFISVPYNPFARWSTFTRVYHAQGFANVVIDGNSVSLMDPANGFKKTATNNIWTSSISPNFNIPTGGPSDASGYMHWSLEGRSIDDTGWMVYDPTNANQGFFGTWSVALSGPINPNDLMTAVMTQITAHNFAEIEYLQALNITFNDSPPMPPDASALVDQTPYDGAPIVNTTFYLPQPVGTTAQSYNFFSAFGSVAAATTQLLFLRKTNYVITEYDLDAGLNQINPRQFAASLAAVGQTVILPTGAPVDITNPTVVTGQNYLVGLHYTLTATPADGQP